MLADRETADKESTPCPRLGLYKMGERFYAPAQIRAFLPFNGAAGLETLLVTWFILGLDVLPTYCLLSTITFGLLIKVSTSGMEHAFFFAPYACHFLFFFVPRAFRFLLPTFIVFDDRNK